MPRINTLRTAVLCLSLMLPAVRALALDDFKPVAPDELAMKDNPKQPGAHAMILEWTDSEDDNNSNSFHYYRIKIFTEEGKKRADIEIPYVKGAFNISDIKARTIHADGTIVPFTGKVFDKLVVKTKDVKFQAKTFSLPDVQPGSVIEYRYRKSWDPDTLYSTYWTLQEDLFVKKATFTLKPYQSGYYGTAWVGIGIPASKKVEKKNGGYTLEIENMPAFDEERYSPPEHELKPRIEFYYTTQDMETVDKFWIRIGKDAHKEVEDFIGHRGGIQSAVGEMVLATDKPEEKLRKIYDKVQQIRNLSYAQSKTEQEEKRDKRKDSHNSEDVLKNGYGYHNELNRLYVALVRAAGFNAEILKVSRRDEVFFKKELLDARQLNGEIVVVHDGDTAWYLDPGTQYCPFGLLPWNKTGVQAMELHKDGGVFVATPEPQSDAAIIRRVAKLKYDDGTFKGTVDVIFRDQEALTWRLNELNTDEAEQKKNFEDMLKRLLPGGSTVTLAAVQNMTDITKPLVVKFEVEMPSPGSSVGSRMLMPMAIFQPADGNPFRHESRVHPIYFSYPFQELDEVDLQMPAGMKVENLPAATKKQTDFGYYDAVWQQTGNTLQLHRRFAVLGVLMPRSIYPELRAFFEQVNSSDQESVVMRAQNTAGK